MFGCVQFFLNTFLIILLYVNIAIGICDFRCKTLLNIIMTDLRISLFVK